jgi:hypothetical protein
MRFDIMHERAGQVVTIPLGDMVSEDTRAILVTFRVGAPTQHCWLGLGTITVSYDDVVGGMHATAISHNLLVGVMTLDKVAAIPSDAAVATELLILRAAKVLQAATAQAETGDVQGTMRGLRDFLAVPEVARHTDPALQVVRRRIKEMLHDLEDRAFDMRSRKHMHYFSHAWTRGQVEGRD